MRLIVKIAFRNLFRHRGRSLVIGVILFAGALVMALGNGIITGMEKGFETNIVNKWTGHIIIVSSRQKNNDPLFSPKPMKVIRNYEHVKTLLANTSGVDSFLPATKGLAMILNIGAIKKAAEQPVLCMLLGVDFQQYKKIFDNITITEGNELQAGKKGLLLNTFERDKILDAENIRIVPEGITPEHHSHETASSLVLMGIGDDNSALDVFASVKGIYTFNTLNLLFKEINIIDLESFRECFEYVTHADTQADISSENLDILNSSSESLDTYFTEATLYETSDIEKDLGTESLKQAVENGDNTPDIIRGSFNLIFVKLVESSGLEEMIQTLNRDFEASNADARAISWEDAIGYIADISLLFRIALNIFVFFIFFVAVIIIINTLSMAAMERVPEIGTMRAIGARQRFIGRMFITETALLALLFGGTGLFIGCILSLLFANLNIPASNEMMSLAFGGDTFRPVINAGSITNGVIQLIAVTVAAILYPVHLAKKVTPVDAIVRD